MHWARSLSRHRLAGVVRVVGAALGLLLAGCFNERTDYSSGELACSHVDRSCPGTMVCASDGKCYKPTELPPPACVDSCDHKTPHVCENGVSVAKPDCVTECKNGVCLACEPGAKRCGDGNQPEQCDDNGSFTAIDPCSATAPRCELGVCKAACGPVGTSRCSPEITGVEECDNTGLYRMTALCPYVCSVTGSAVGCTGVCKPGARRCGADQTPQHCDETGSWIDETACMGVCGGAGVCTGECRPGGTRCVVGSSTMEQVCDPTAHWGTAVACTFVCSTSTQGCDGVCTPGDKRCAGTSVQLCGASGFWADALACTDTPCTRGECKACTEGLTQCNAGVPQHCAAGAWIDNQADHCPFVCNDDSGCTGECVPGNNACDGATTLKTCGKDGKITRTSCQFACLPAVAQCGGLCVPGARRCDAGTAQLCGSDGNWGAGQSCAYGCDDPSGMCKPCVDEALATTCAGGGCGPKKNNCMTDVTCPSCAGSASGDTCGGGGVAGICGCNPELATVTCRERCSDTTNNCGDVVHCAGGCTFPESCNGGGVTGACGCTRMTKAQACSGKNCGTVLDGCGGTTSCWPDGQSQCTASGATCGGGGEANECGCMVTSDPCSGRVCGSATDSCGVSHVCGGGTGQCAGGKMCNGMGQCVDLCAPLLSCPAGDDCGAVDPGCGAAPLACNPGCSSDKPVCIANHCTCTPLTACPANACGTVSDGCGGTLSCSCSGGQICDPTNALCRDQTMAEACAGKNCGSVTSGGSTYVCGNCASPESCGGAGQNDVCGCTPTVASCPSMSNCGSVDDGCGHPITCGPDCTGTGQSCGGGGTANVCGCIYSTNECDGAECGNSVDNCGNAVSCGTCPPPTSGGRFICTDGLCDFICMKCSCDPDLCCGGKLC